MREERCFVQFIHPGGEHRPDSGDLKLWNTGAHQRKFLRGRGRYVDRGESKSSEIVFWGEWEPESWVVRRYPAATGGQPRFLYEPYYIDHEDGVWRQNTDPFVFGEAFHYTGCMQHTKNGPTQLRFLTPGSVVLFGSCQEKRSFVVDTVFVVADFVDHSRADHVRQLAGRISATYRSVTIDPWYRAALPDGQSHRLYFGATNEKPLDGMFSFVPCRPHAGGSEGFARPRIECPDLITPHLTQGKKLARDLSMSELAAIWRNVADQIEAQGLFLGVQIELPPRQLR